MTHIFENEQTQGPSVDHAAEPRPYECGGGEEGQVGEDHILGFETAAVTGKE